ncbi:MAG: SIS domain-containing protein [Leptospirales bacterium]|jgi:D-sedoheptulose 7-phosphate isomerase
MRELVQAHIRRSIEAKEKLIASALDDIVRGGERLTGVLQNGGKLLICGNGGSAADAQHIATEYLIRYRAKPERPSLPALSLAADSSTLTAGGNDFGFDHVFARQIEGLGQSGDGLLAISTSGNSVNVIQALKAARAKKMVTVLLTGGDGGRAVREHADAIDVCVRVPHEETSRIQECHIMIGQIFCAMTEKTLFDID